MTLTVPWKGEEEKRGEKNKSHAALGKVSGGRRAEHSFQVQVGRGALERGQSPTVLGRAFKALTTI